LFFFILPIDKQQLNQVSGTLKLLRWTLFTVVSTYDSYRKYN
jgi:hypothetical protein